MTGHYSIPHTEVPYTYDKYKKRKILKPSDKIYFLQPYSIHCTIQGLLQGVIQDMITNINTTVWTNQMIQQIMVYIQK